MSWVLKIFLILICSDVFALPFSNQYSFAPPPSDLSVIYLSNIFGVVDGVLSGTGSQIFGRMMGVFNASLLALGSMLLIYTIIVGTLYTAHEGEFLGRQWSSIWIPLRSVLGVSLLVPKASGYSMIQIMVMWVVIQGVGAADKVWNAALDYLNSGGTIIQAQMESTPAKTGSISSPNYIGAATILTGQVCMLGLQNIIQDKHNQLKFLASGDTPTGPCNPNSDTYNDWQAFCTTDVPDFLGTVNFVDVQKNDDIGKLPQGALGSHSVKMPNFSNASIPFYQSLNGLCGTIQWDSLTTSIGTQNADALASNASSLVQSLQPNQLYNIFLTRPIAIQQMYDNLSVIAQQMVQNDPQLNSSLNNVDQSNIASPAAVMQYGVPMQNYTKICQAWDSTCQLWSGVPLAPAGVLFAGNEFNNALNAYNGVMMPTLSLIQQIESDTTAQNLKGFISQSEQDGWMFAGSYFFKLIGLNGSPINNQNLIDSKSGLDKSTMYQLDFTCPETLQPNTLCWLLAALKNSADMSPIDNINYLLSAAPNKISPPLCNGSTLSLGSFSTFKGYVEPVENLSSVTCSSTTLGYIGNTYFLAIPGQPGITAPKFPDFDFSLPSIGSMKVNMNINVPCGGINLGFVHICLAAILLDPFWGTVLSIVNSLIPMLEKVAYWLFNAMLVKPLEETIYPALQQAYVAITTPSSNPIVSLANMGGNMIDITVQGYIELMMVALMGAIPEVGIIVVILFAFVAPIYTAWLALFLSIGFMTAYYVPLLPYIIFTFGTISWLMAVIESMVAAPIMALGVMTPEGDGVLGKAEQGFMILVNVFLRPSMMVIGFIAAIAMTYVSVWVLNQGFGTAAEFLSQGKEGDLDWTSFFMTEIMGNAFFVFIYISLYMTVVQKSFTLIYVLPDKVLRWIGGHPESYGSETQQWLDESRKLSDDFGQKSSGGIVKGMDNFQGKVTNAVASGGGSQSSGDSGSASGGGDSSDGDGKSGGGKSDGGGKPGGDGPPPEALV